MQDHNGCQYGPISPYEQEERYYEIKFYIPESQMVNTIKGLQITLVEEEIEE